MNFPDNLIYSVIMKIKFVIQTENEMNEFVF